ncbi:MAG: (Fe-S)-binding protein [Alphaproteobacteria bacterium]|jgi:Fe-S oxidoreductase|nr:(Fe-S)-binding protein [Alphaproteobacteria bacterium]MDP6564914.1 (Fe-S)-binding protein [Alphaproteobacteria bacterium]MDP6814336.1 (Fe-S)-binding protein [Alphaproteobacteria bacterium]
MALQKQHLDDYLTIETGKLAAACTACGKCVEVCPVTPFTGTAPEDGPAVIGGLLSLLKDGGPMEPAARAWSDQCNGCGICIPACPEAVNPRRLVMLAQTAEARQGSATPQLFRKMSRAIRIMAAMQLAPEEYGRLLRVPRARPAPVVFYLGCNPIRTPHLLFNAMVILDALEVDYQVLGGPGACCGIIHAKWQGDMAQGERVVDGTLDRFADQRPERVLSWCPSCLLHLGETLQEFRATSFAFDHITDLLAERSAELARKFLQPIERRALLHVHDGMAGIGDNVAGLLRAIPGLTLVEMMAEPGYTCGGSGADRSPALKAERRAALLERAAADDVDVLVTLYHGCHAQLAATEARGDFEVLNWTDLLVQALGQQPHDDISKRYRMRDDWDLVLDEGESYLRANGVAVDRDWLKGLLPEIFAQAEFTGGLEAFANTDRGAP